MYKYMFWAGSIKGLSGDLEIHADSWGKAIKAVKKHIIRRHSHLKDVYSDVIAKVKLDCDECGHTYEGHEHIDPVGNKNTPFDQLIQKRLCKNSKYLAFQKLHSKHKLQEGGWLKAIG